MTDGDPLYDIDIQTAASPSEVAAFCDLLESHDYLAVTDLQQGKLRLYDDSEVSEE